MENSVLKGIEPQAVFSYFEQICAIPHGSGNTKQISDFLVQFAKGHGLSYRQDALNNVILFADATCGMETHEPVILQGHMDMVCEKDADCSIDMTQEGLELAQDGKFLFAKGTTLGGDDGIAVAFALALLADKSLAHPPLEVILTVDEETGMYGAEGIDLSDLKGKRLVNMDSEDEGIFTVSCAGGTKSILSLPLRRTVQNGRIFTLSVGHLQGGHSGVEIHKSRANANKVMAKWLSRLQKAAPFSLLSMQGGAKDNAIPRSCTASVLFQAVEPAELQTATELLEQELKAQFDEPQAVLRITETAESSANALCRADTEKVLALLEEVPNGVQAYSRQIEGLVQTSLNLGILTLEASALRLVFSVRSSIDAERHALVQRLQEICTACGAQYRQTGDYPAWEYKEASPLRDTFIQVYRRLYHAEPRVEAIHAGLECGLLLEKKPDLDCISFGPQMHDIHTSREKLDIASVKRTWELLLAVLKAL